MGIPGSVRQGSVWVWVGVVAVAVAALPWLAPAVPTKDGPSHLYNAWVIVHLDDPTFGLARHFQVVPQAPNWGGTAPLVLFLGVLPPVAAEKLLMSLILGGLVVTGAGIGRGVDGDPVLLALLAGVVAHGFLFVMGFTGYLVALVMGLALAAWELRRPHTDVVSGSRAAVPALALATVFFAHLAGALVAAGLWLLAAVLRRRPTWRNAVVSLAALLPLGLLLAGHAARRAGVAPPVYREDHSGPRERLVRLVTGGFWEAFSPEDRVVGAVLIVLVLGLVALRLVRPRAPLGREARWLLLAGGVCAVGYLVIPWALAGGAFVPDRLVPLLILLSAAGAVAGEPPRMWARTIAALILVGALGVRADQYRLWGSLQMQLTDEVPPIPPGTTVYLASRPDVATSMDLLSHIWGRVAIRDGLVALDDYEASLVGLFPVAFRPPTLELAERLRDGERPPGVVPFGWRSELPRQGP